MTHVRKRGRDGRTAKAVRQERAKLRQAQRDERTPAQQLAVLRERGCRADFGGEFERLTASL